MKHRFPGAEGFRTCRVQSDKDALVEIITSSLTPSGHQDHARVRSGFTMASAAGGLIHLRRRCSRNRVADREMDDLPAESGMLFRSVGISNDLPHRHDPDIDSV
jgi:hypothetical protein